MLIKAKKSRKSRGSAQDIRQKTLKNLTVQLVAMFIVAIVVSAYSWVAGYSAFFGGVIYLIPHAYAANKLLVKKYELTSAKQTLAELYIGQIWKMVIGALLFALVFVLVKPLSPFSLFGSYIAMQALGWYLQMKADKRFIKL